jgi:hypothetical protein
MNMTNQTFKSVFLGIVSNLITAIIIPVITIALGFYLTVSLESRLAIFNMALILAAILLILNLRFSPRRVRVIRPHEQPHVYFIEKNIARHIPDQETFNYLGQIYGFDWKDIDMVTNDEFKKQFSTGSTLPSIVPHCLKFCEQKQKSEQSVQQGI